MNDASVRKGRVWCFVAKAIEEDGQSVHKTLSASKTTIRQKKKNSFVDVRFFVTIVVLGHNAGRIAARHHHLPRMVIVLLLCLRGFCCMMQMLDVNSITNAHRMHVDVDVSDVMVAVREAVVVFLFVVLSIC